jgi:hypothetical protein
MDPLNQKPPPPAAGDTYSTDEIISVFEHLARNTKSWDACVADHGLEPVYVGRTLKTIFGEGGGIGKTATQAFVLGLQFGAMRLPPVEYDESQEKPCNCMFCQMRRAIEESEGGGA